MPWTNIARARVAVGRFCPSTLMEQILDNLDYVRSISNNGFAGNASLGDVTNPVITAPGVYHYRNLTVTAVTAVPSGSIILVSGDLVFTGVGALAVGYSKHKYDWDDRLAGRGPSWPRVAGSLVHPGDMGLAYGVGHAGSYSSTDKGAGGSSIGIGGAGFGTAGPAQAWDGVLGLRHMGFLFGGHAGHYGGAGAYTVRNRGAGGIIVRVGGDITGYALNGATQAGHIYAIGETYVGSHENGGGGGSVCVYCQGEIDNLYLSAKGGAYFDSDNGAGGGGLVVAVGPNAADAGAVYTNVQAGNVGGGQVWNATSTNGGAGAAHTENADPVTIHGVV